jgi:hypothetical protein
MRKLAVRCAHFILRKFGKDSALKRWGGSGTPRRKECEEARGRCRCTEGTHFSCTALEDIGELRSVLWLHRRTVGGLNGPRKKFATENFFCGDCDVRTASVTRNWDSDANRIFFKLPFSLQ